MITTIMKTCKTTKFSGRTNTQWRKRKELNIFTIENHPIAKTNNKRSNKRCTKKKSPKNDKSKSSSINNNLELKQNKFIKKYKLSECIKNEDITICYLQETHLTSKDTQRLKVKGWQNVFHANRNQK